MKILTADYVLPISAPPIENGAVAIDGSKIVAVGTRDEITTQFPTASVEDHGEAAILPGFVNCHSHLEITSMRGALDDVEHDFSAWLLKLNGLRAELTDEDICAAAVAGAVEGAHGGVTCFGDIGRMGHAGLAALKQVGLRGIVYQETEFSPDNRTADEDFVKLATKYETLREEETDLVRVGLSPHSPYTVGSRLFELIAEYSILNRVPLTIHAAESADETELLALGTGLFRGFYEKFDIEWHSPHCTSIEYLERLGVLSTQPLLAHCINVSESDLSKIRDNGAKIAHCPKSNAKFGHGYAPFEAFFGSGRKCWSRQRFGREQQCLRYVGRIALCRTVGAQPRRQQAIYHGKRNARNCNARRSQSPRPRPPDRDARTRQTGRHRRRFSSEYSSTAGQ